MITLSGILSQSFGGIYTLRGYATYADIVETSYPHEAYQRPEDQQHINDIESFIKKGINNFSPEVVLAYTAKYDYNAPGALSGLDPLKELNEGRGFASNVDNVKFLKGKKVDNGYLYTIKIPDKKGVAPFRRVDGNHRLKAFERLIDSGQANSSYLIPFCIIIFSDNSDFKDEKTIFHNINSKAVPIKSEQLLNSVIIEQNKGSDFSDEELQKEFGEQYLLIRRIIQFYPLIIDKLEKVKWIRNKKLTTLIELVEYLKKDYMFSIVSQKEINALQNAISYALDNAKVVSDEELKIPSGMLFILTSLYYDKELSKATEKEKKEQNIKNLLSWVEKYSIQDLLVDNENNAVENARCILSIYNKYRDAERFQIFLSRCFASEYDETEKTIRRAISVLNKEKHVNIVLHRVDQHSNGSTGDISGRVLTDIKQCGLVIADLSSGKLNIPHEIGYAMGLGKELIIIHNGTEEEADNHTPTNIKMYEQIRFNNNYTYLENNLKKKLVDFYKL